VAAVVAAIARSLRELSVQAEFLLPEDPPADNVAGFPVRAVPGQERVRDARAPVTCGGFLRAAQQTARGRWLITLEDPTEDDMSLVFAFWHRRHEADLLVASRYVPGGAYRMPRLRALVSRVLNRVYRFGLSVPVRDLSSARRMYRMAILRRVAIDGNDYDVLMEVLLKVMAQGGRVAEVPWYFESAKSRLRAATFLRLFGSCARTFWRMHALRNSVDFPDYDSRAYDSRIPLQRYWQRRRFRIIREFADHTGRVLDIGCGSSRITTTRPEVYALDINMNRLRHIAPSNPRRIRATAGALPFADGTFDCVISSQVIEHTSEAGCVAEAARVLRPGGVLVIGTPDYATFWWPLIERVYGWVKRGGYADEHVTRYTRAVLTDELERAGCIEEAHAYIGGAELIVRAVKSAGRDGHARGRSGPGGEGRE